MAQRGGQLGNQNASGKAPKRMARRALKMLLAAAKAQDRDELHDIWDAQVKKAKEGDANAARLIIEHLDGKPRQQTELTGAGGGALVVQVVKFADADPHNPQ